MWRQPPYLAASPPPAPVQQLLPNKKPMYMYSEVTASALYRYYDMPYISGSQGRGEGGGGGGHGQLVSACVLQREGA